MATPVLSLLSLSSGLIKTTTDLWKYWAGKKRLRSKAVSSAGLPSSLSGQEFEDTLAELRDFLGCAIQLPDL